MKSMTVISRANLPTNLPIFHTLLVYFMMDYYDVPGWAQGAVYTVVGLLWIVAAVAMFNQEFRTPMWEKE